MVSFAGFRKEEGVPIYLQIVDYIKRGIVAGQIHGGDEFPSRRELSALLGVNPNTIQKACRMLEEAGLLQSHTGAKSYLSVEPGVVEALRREQLEGAAAALVRRLREMGLDQAGALELVARLWENGEGGETP